MKIFFFDLLWHFFLGYWSASLFLMLPVNCNLMKEKYLNRIAKHCYVKSETWYLCLIDLAGWILEMAETLSLKNVQDQSSVNNASSILDQYVINLLIDIA